MDVTHSWCPPSFVIDGITEDEHEAWQKMVYELLHSGFGSL